MELWGRILHGGSPSFRWGERSFTWGGSLVNMRGELLSAFRALFGHSWAFYSEFLTLLKRLSALSGAFCVLLGFLGALLAVFS